MGLTRLASTLGFGKPVTRNTSAISVYYDAWLRKKRLCGVSGFFGDPVVALFMAQTREEDPMVLLVVDAETCLKDEELARRFRERELPRRVIRRGEIIIRDDEFPGKPEGLIFGTRSLGIKLAQSSAT